jgi:hypothetical protein
MSSSDPRALMQQYYDAVWQRGNFTVGDELVATDVVDHMPLPVRPRVVKAIMMRCG